MQNGSFASLDTETNDINCAFCQRSNFAANILKETDTFFIIADHAPLVEGHILIMPRRHFACYGAGTPAFDGFLERGQAAPMGLSEEPFTAEWVAESIEAYLPAIEIVDDRYVDWQTLGAPTLVADDFFAAGCVLGKPVARVGLPDVLHVIGRALVNGVEVGRGSAADVLGHPHNALAWLANHLAADGKNLRAGQIVLTGSLVKTVWLNAGDEVFIELEGLGRVEARFA
jgi:hypothetical protein